MTTTETKEQLYPVAKMPWMHLTGFLVLLVLFVFTAIIAVGPAVETTERPELVIVVYLAAFALTAGAWAWFASRWPTNRAVAREVTDLRQLSEYFGNNDALSVPTLKRLEYILTTLYRTRQGQPVQAGSYTFVCWVGELVKQYGALELAKMATDDTLEKVLLGLPDDASLVTTEKSASAWSQPTTPIVPA